MNKIKIRPVDNIKLYKKAVILFIGTESITYKIHNITDMSFENLQKRVYGL
ncbi:hypothetical protein [Paraclostridium sp.]|uniref:hypothetical protein n=1 Tax=Paraclostridium sp. TaxID=2023273 RepID=UPI003F67DC5D